MGSCCAFVPQQPWLVLSISKSGQLVLQDVRRLGHPLLAQQLQGPVYDMAWAVRQGQGPAGAAAGCGDGVPAAGGELALCVVGADECVRSYAFTTEALATGERRTVAGFAFRV